MLNTDSNLIYKVLEEIRDVCFRR